VSPRSGERGVIASAELFLDIVEQMDMGPLNHFTCTEVTALADLMAADRGEEKGMFVILHHLLDGDDEEQDELTAHLEEWPGLADLIRLHASDDDDILDLLNEIEKEQ
jgi:hypothetical protein